MKLFSFSAFFLFATFALTSIANATPASDLNSLLNGIHTMQADFSQVVQDNRGKAVQKSYGKITLARPGKFRWDVKKPIPQLIIANNTKLWIYDADLQQVTIKSIKKNGNDTPALLLSNQNANLESDYIVTQINKPGNLRWFSLAPLKKDSMFNSIQMAFNDKHIEEMRLEDHLGHKTVVVFKNARLNESYPESLFNFKAAKGVDVIDDSSKK